MVRAAALAAICALGAVPAVAELKVTVRGVALADTSRTQAAALDSSQVAASGSSRALLAAALRAAAAHMDSLAARRSVADSSVAGRPGVRVMPADHEGHGLVAWLAEWGAVLQRQQGVTAVRIPHRAAEGHVAVPLLTSLPALLHARINVRSATDGLHTYDVALAVEGYEARPVSGVLLRGR